MTYGFALLHADRLAQERERKERNKLPKAFVKVTGDRLNEPLFHDWLATLTKTHKVIVCVGGGTQINEEFDARGLPVKKHPLLGRDTDTEGLRVAHTVLKNNKARLCAALRARGAKADILLPIVYMADELCHVDADLMVLNAYWGFETLYVVTTPERVAQKREQFSSLPKVHILSF